MRLTVLCGLALNLCGCHLSQWLQNGFKVGPNYQPTPAAVADNWIDSDDSRVISQPPEYYDWWSVLQDPVINHLVETAYRQNLTVRQAGLRVMQARAQRAIAAGNLFPQSQTISGSYAREQISIVQQPLLAPLPEFRRSFDAWSLAGNLSWELDIWGRFRRDVESADADLDVAVQEYDAILVCLIAEVATAYTDIRTFEQRLIYARRNVQIQEQSLELTKTQADEGKTGFISVHLSTSNLDDTRASIPPLESGLRQANNRLCTLLGIPPVDLKAMLGQGNIPNAPAEAAVGIPADLLRRRPDVRAAESQVAAQSAQIGIAISDFYPSIAVTGQISTQAEEFRDLFRPLSVGGSIGPSFSWNVLNYGRIRNNVRFQDARFQELVANYQNTVLTANQEVEDALVAFLKTQQQVKFLAGTVNATRSALELELLNFKEGETDFTGVFVLQGDLAGKQDQLAAAQGDVVTSLIAMYKALGGGWQIRCPNVQPRGITAPEPAPADFKRLPPASPEPVPAPTAPQAFRGPALEAIRTYGDRR
ncbi:MAG: efflux transporter outer membrane subunit [Planctomycetota bacterium]|nr:efflux transporter outer membrane subunit [Planctomycetota bacterium]